MPKKSATSFDDNISYVKQTLRAKAERRNPGQSERASGSSTTALENKVEEMTNLIDILQPRIAREVKIKKGQPLSADLFLFNKTINNHFFF